MTEQQRLDLRKDEVEAGTTTGLASPSVDVTSDRQNSLWSDAWSSLKKNVLFWIGAFLTLLAVGIALALRLKARRPPVAVNAPGAGLVGRHGMLLPMEGPELRVRIGDSDWPARLPADVKVPDAPLRVRVEGVSGTVLVVRPIG